MFLTYSRTAYLVFLAVVFLLFYIHKYPHKPLVSLENIIKIMLPFALVLGWFIFLSPFSALFLESDVDQQVGNREMHFAMALEAFQVSPFIGIGMNTHLEFFKEYYYLLSFLDLNEFFYENHIHNIHLIILAEAGSIGLLLWILFLFVNIGRAKKQLARGRNQILSLTQIGLIIIYFLNGFTDWAPFSSSIMPLFLFLMYFSIKYRRGNRVRVRAISRRPAYNLASSDSTVAAT
jgi:O-antigen ligase